MLSGTIQEVISQISLPFLCANDSGEKTEKLQEGTEKLAHPNVITCLVDRYTMEDGSMCVGVGVGVGGIDYRIQETGEVVSLRLIKMKIIFL